MMPANNTKSSKSSAEIIQRARSCFNFKNWAADYFDIDPKGNLICRPTGQSGPEIVLSELIRQAADSSFQTPLLVRFPDILRHRVHRVCEAFDREFQSSAYHGSHTIAYPIKVNQQQCVVENIIQALPHRVGLEAGSKPELMAVLAQSLGVNQQENLGTIICNGYKDREYIRLALIGSLLVKRTYIVVEQPGELGLLLEQSQELGITPRLGVRVRLSSIAQGRWQDSGGEKSKFGLSASQLLGFVEHLKQVGKLEYLQLLHFHIGSQVADLKDINTAINEAGRYYQELSQQGAPIKVVDVGGGLSIDYDGSHSSALFSANYSVEEYAAKIVSALAERCQQAGLPHPKIITECGRAITAHHAVLITDVIDVEQQDAVTKEFDSTIHPLATELYKLQQEVNDEKSSSGLESVVADCERLIKNIHLLFVEQTINLEQRAALDQMLMQVQSLIGQKVRHMQSSGTTGLPVIARVADKYFCNFSLFQSIPDVWGIEQVFPIVPLSRLHQPLTREAVIHDLTCDSDGQVGLYPVNGSLLPTLPVHSIKADEKYYLGIFLVGAYQEVLGDMHNLFGDTHSINAILTETGAYTLQAAEPGDRIDQLLEYVHYDCDHLLNQYRMKLDRTELSAEDKEKYYQELFDGLSGYTYFED